MGSVIVQEERLIILGITVVVTLVLWAWTRYTRVGLPSTPARRTTGGADAGLVARPPRRAHLDGRRLLAGFAAVLAAPLTGLSAMTFTIVVTVAGLGAALLGGFQSFPLTLLGGIIIGIGEAMATRYGSNITSSSTRT